MHIYIAKNGTQTGPFSEEQLHGMITGGLLLPSDLAWRDGMPDWQPLHTLLGLRQPPPVPPVSQPVGIPPAITDQPVGPSGIGGWLTFFCVGLTILNPLYAIVSMTNNWSQSQVAFIRFPTIKTVLIWENFGSIVLLIYGFIVGCIILNGNPIGRSIARQYLVIRLFSFIGVELCALLMMSGLPSKIVVAGISGAVGSAFQALVYFLIWWFYFKKSKRVKNTYGREHIQQ